MVIHKEDEFAARYAKAVQAQKLAEMTEPRARVARYENGYIVLELRNGASYHFAPRLVQGIANARPEDLSQIEVTPSGAVVRWPVLDVGLSVPDLLAGRFGNQAWMQELLQEHRDAA